LEAYRKFHGKSRIDLLHVNTILHIEVTRGAHSCML
jgi:hypothetical protein